MKRKSGEQDGNDYIDVIGSTSTIFPENTKVAYADKSKFNIESISVNVINLQINAKKKTVKQKQQKIRVVQKRQLL